MKILVYDDNDEMVNNYKKVLPFDWIKSYKTVEGILDEIYLNGDTYKYIFLSFIKHEKLKGLIQVAQAIKDIKFKGKVYYYNASSSYISKLEKIISGLRYVPVSGILQEMTGLIDKRRRHHNQDK